MSAFDLDNHLRQGGTVQISYDHGTPDKVIDARFDAYVSGEPPSYQAVARTASGSEVATGWAPFHHDPTDAVRDLRAPEKKQQSITDHPDCPF